MNIDMSSDGIGAFSLPDNGIYEVMGIKRVFNKSVKIGVISAENKTYIPDVLSLFGADITQINTYLPPIRDTHPTAVLNEIVGQRVIADGRELSGLVPNAQVYIASVRTARGVYRAVEEMVSLGVKVINYSAGNERGGYSDFDREIDRLISQYNFLFVTAAGNSTQLTSPGRCLNGISVGNLLTKNYPDIALMPPFSVWCDNADNCSAFSADGVHKPDIVAPGAWIGYAVSESEINYNNFGTSYACPFVSAIASAVYATLGESMSFLTVKGILLLSAANDTVSPADNPPVNEYILLRSGYGVVQGDRAIKIAEGAQIIEGEITGDYEVEFSEMLAVFEAPGAEITVGDEVFSLGEQNTFKLTKRSREKLPMSVRADGRFSVIVI